MESQIPAKVGRYEVLAELGRGAMGAVYRGVDPKLDRVVAIKMISASMAGGDDRTEILARFEREARVAAKLQHPNVVAVYDVGAEGDELYLVMELVDGETLGHRLARGQFPSLIDALELIAQSADALAAAHDAGIIHRDVKPGNLLITKSGKIKVGDFGVAKAIGEKTDLTRTGMMVGSPAYMSPEQVKGIPLDSRSDLFSLGVVLYEVVLHKKPFPADTVTSLVYQILHEDPMRDVPIPEAVSTDLADFLRWTLAKDRDQRVPDARSFAARARAIAAGDPIARLDATGETSAIPMPAIPEAKTSRLAKPAAPSQQTTTIEGQPSRAGLYVGIAAALAVVGGLAAWLLRGPSPEAPAAAPSAQEVPVVQVQTVERAAPPPSDATDSQLTETIPEEELEEVPPPESSGDGLSAPTPSRPVTPTKPRLPGSDSEAGSGGAGATVAAGDASQPANASSPAGFVVPQVAIAEEYESKRGVQFHVRPDETVVTINGVAIGIADQWDGFGGGKTYNIPAHGEYYVELKANGYQTAWIRLTIKPDARETTVKVRTKLAKNQ